MSAELHLCCMLSPADCSLVGFGRNIDQNKISKILLNCCIYDPHYKEDTPFERFTFLLGAGTA